MGKGDKPERATTTARVSLSMYPEGLFLYKNKLVVFGYDNEPPYYPENRETQGDDYNNYYYGYYYYNPYQTPYTEVLIYDITDPAAPVAVNRYQFEGDFANARLIDNDLYFVTKKTGAYFKDRSPLPQVFHNGTRVTAVTTSIHYVNAGPTTYDLTHVAGLSLSESGNGKLVDRDVFAIPRYQEVLYVSDKNMYFAFTQYLDTTAAENDATGKVLRRELGADKQEALDQVLKADIRLIDSYDKSSYLGDLYEEIEKNKSSIAKERLAQRLDDALAALYKDVGGKLQQTFVHKFGLSNAKTAYAASGHVPGNVINQFALDEKDDYLRIATTNQNWWSWYLDEEDLEDQGNNIYVLDKAMDVSGKVTGLAPDESIYAVRYIGNRGYLVTYEQVDPLFAIDLSNPTKPALLGELKIPGYSTYLHPYDENILIGVG